MCLWPRGFQRFSEVFRGFQRFSEVLGWFSDGSQKVFRGVHRFSKVSEVFRGIDFQRFQRFSELLSEVLSEVRFEGCSEYPHCTSTLHWEWAGGERGCVQEPG